jgi:hypothetical protein
MTSDDENNTGACLQPLNIIFAASACTYNTMSYIPMFLHRVPFLLDGPLPRVLVGWPEEERKEDQRDQDQQERQLFESFGPSCVQCGEVVLLPEQPVRCGQHHCNALLHEACWALHTTSCTAASPAKRRKLHNMLPNTDPNHLPAYAHVSPPPPRWSHNACGPESIQEVGGMLLRCVNGLRPLLSTATIRTLDKLTIHRKQDAAITEATPWQSVHKCHCSRCIRDGATAQDNYVEKELFKHMNRHRTLNDETFEEMGPYTVGDFTDVRRMFESYLGLRTVSHPHHARPGLGLCVIEQCVNCGRTTSSPGMLEVEASGIGRAFPGMPKTCTTQQIVDQAIGKDSLLEHLQEDEATRLTTVQRWGTRCPAKCVNNNGAVWANTMLPLKLDSQQPLPPLLRVTKGLYNDRLSAVSDTITVAHNDEDVTYKLLAVVYGNTKHFTTCVRYHIDEGDEQFYHFDPFHFEVERVLPLSGNLPACMGGMPEQTHHTRHMKETFQRYTHLRNVAAAVYGIIGRPVPDQDMVSVSDEAVLDGHNAQHSQPSDMHDCEHCLAEQTWVCPSCTYNNPLREEMCQMCGTDQSAVPMATTSVPVWACSTCTYHNHLEAVRCALCTAARPAPLWTCQTCTYDNPFTEEKCTICGRDRPEIPVRRQY